MLSRILNRTIEGDPPVSLLSTRCTRHRNRKNLCSRCIAACPHDAIFFEKTISIDATKCTGCLACVANCPTEALAPPPGAYSFRETCLDKTGETILLTCTEHPYSNPEMSVPCLGAVSPEDLAGLMILSGEVRIDISTCAKCERSAVLPALRRNIAAVKTITGLQNISLLESPLATDGQEGRRIFFGLLHKLSIKTGKDILAQQTIRQPPHKAGKHKTERSLFLVSALGRKENGFSTVRKIFFKEIAIAESCDCCGRCVGGCPTGSLQITRNTENIKMLTHLRTSCCNCGLCFDFCPRQSLYQPPQTTSSVP